MIRFSTTTLTISKATAALAALGAVAMLALAAPSAHAAGSGANADGPIHTLAYDGSGGFYIGGEFGTVTVGSVTTDRINAAHILADGSVDPNWAPNPDAAVRALHVTGGNVYLGGEFANLLGSDLVNGSTIVRATSLARVSTGGTIDSSWTPAISSRDSVTPVVRGIDSDGTNVYFTGSFDDKVGGASRNNAAAVSVSSGAVQSWNPNLNGAGRAIALSSGNVYLGGDFTTVGGTTRNRAAAVGTNGTLGSWNPNLNGAVNALHLNVSGSTVYLGGAFTTVGGTTTRNRAAAVGTDGTLASWNPNFDGAVNSIDTDGSNVYLAGAFTTQNGTARGKAAAVTTSGTSVNWNPNFLGGDVSTIFAVGGVGIATGGNFSSINLTSTSGQNNNTPQDNYAGPAITAATISQNTNNNPVSLLSFIDNKAQLKGQNWSFFDAAGNATSLYQWQRCTTLNDASSCSNIVGKAVTGAWYGVTDNDINYQLRLNVYYNTVSGLIQSFTAITPVAIPVRNVAPAIVSGLTSGAPKRNVYLKPSFGVWNGYVNGTSTYETVWQRCLTSGSATCSTVTGAAGSGYWFKPTTAGSTYRYRFGIKITTRGRTTDWAYTAITGATTN
ncbi:MAG: hypothetical protein WCO96_04640 [Actinomycetes bacterium]